MELLFQRAKSFASEAAKRSQDLAKEAAKLSQEFALETAKRSKEIASEASKKADALKVLAGEISPPLAIPVGTSFPASASVTDDELLGYGVTSELRQFVSGLTINTFQDFPSEDLHAIELAGNSMAASNTEQDLTEWQAQHAKLMLKAVPEMSQLRYSLCPRVMKERRFWNIYFTLVRGHIAQYEKLALQNSGEQESSGFNVVDDAMANLAACTSATSSVVQVVRQDPSTAGSNDKLAQDPPATSKPAQKSRTIEDRDLDAYLLGDLDSGSDNGDADAFDDTNFDDLVNGTDSEEEEKASKVPTAVCGAGTSDVSSDGELVGFPSDLDKAISGDDGL